MAAMVSSPTPWALGGCTSGPLAMVAWPEGVSGIQAVSAWAPLDDYQPQVTAPIEGWLTVEEGTSYGRKKKMQRVKKQKWEKVRFSEEEETLNINEVSEPE